jgi:two-component system response regulator FlrC
MSNTNATIALLDSQDTGLDMLAEMASSAGMVALPAHDLSELAVLMGRSPIDLLVINATSLRVPLVAVFKQLAASLNRAGAVVLVEASDVVTAVDAMALGAKNVLTLPIEPGRFKRYLSQLLECRPDGFICRDIRSQQLLALSERVAQTDVTVLIGGESGAGKEVLAKHIHQASPRSKSEFVAVNCASIPETMLEDMLFGHEKGSFTGAHQRYLGLFEQAQGGTLFLDEVGELPFSLQAKLLRVVQEKELKRLGVTEVIKLYTSIISATNRNLQKEVVEKRFREDLYYRLNVFPLKLLPLRERAQDILPIAQFLLQRHRGTMGPLAVNAQFDKAALSFLQAYSWPGNVRELENVVQRALVLAVGGGIGLEHLLVDGGLDDFMEKMPNLGLVHNVSSLPQAMDQQVQHEDYQTYQATGTDGNFVGQDAQNRGLSEVARDSEQKMIINTLDRLNGSRKDAALELGISSRTLRYKLAKMKDLGMAIPS